MINTVTIITNDYDALGAKIKPGNLPEEAILVSFVVNSIESLEKLTVNAIHNSPLLKNRNINFSLYFEFKNNSLPSIHYSRLLQYFFHPQYKITDRRPVLCFNHDDSEKPELKKLISGIDQILSNQGYPGIQPVYFSGNYKNSNYCFTSGHSPNEITNAYFELMNSCFYTSKYIGIKSNSIENILMGTPNFISLLKQSESMLLEKNPNLFNFLKKLNKLEKYSSALNEELRLTKLDLKNQNTYLSFFKNNDEAEKINEFYYYEYEILPLWYKRLGHIIKVLTGKRTFRSLFDSNVKKYIK